MNKYINAEKLADFARNHVGGMIDVNDIERFPVEEVEPIKHGHWIVKTVFGMVSASCSECGKGALGTVDMNDNFEPTLSPACPFCFARMDGTDLKPQEHCGKTVGMAVFDDWYAEKVEAYKKKK